MQDYEYGTVWRGHGSHSLDLVLKTGAVKAPRLEDMPLTGEIHATANINTFDEGNGGMVCFTPSEKFAYLYALKESSADPATIAAAFDRTFPNEPGLSNLRRFFLERNFMAPESRSAIAEALRLNRTRIRRNEAELAGTDNAERKRLISDRLRTLTLREILLTKLLSKVDEDGKVAEDLRAIRTQYPAILAFDKVPNLRRIQLRLLPGHAPDLELGHKGDVPIRPHLRAIYVPDRVIVNIRTRIEKCGLDVEVNRLSA